MMMRVLVVVLVTLGLSPLARASALSPRDVLSVEPVAEGVWAVVGPLGQRAPDNAGNNATFGVIATDAGAILIDSGGSALGAAALEAVVQELTDGPVALVINTGGQDHRWFGNGYFQARGARLLASDAAVADQAERAPGQAAILRQLIGAERLEGTALVQATETVAAPRDLTVGGVRLRLLPVGPAHTPGDMLVWLPEAGVVFAGDVVYHQRLLGVMPYSNVRHWLEAFDALAALEPRVVVPGHGRPAGLEVSRAQTRAYLAHLRTEVGKVLEAGGDEVAAMAVHQDAFSDLENFAGLSGRNAQQVYMEMEWE